MRCYSAREPCPALHSHRIQRPRRMPLWKRPLRGVGAGEPDIALRPAAMARAQVEDRAQCSSTACCLRLAGEIPMQRAPLRGQDRLREDELRRVKTVDVSVAREEESFTSLHHALSFL